MDPSVSAADLIQRLRAGNAEAAEWLYRNYAQRLTRVAEQHLHRKIVARLDGEDIVQSAFRTFFRRASAGEFQIDGSGPLWKLLVTITIRKAQAKARYHTAARRDIGAQERGDDCFLEALAQEPSPDEAAALVDQIENLLRNLPPLYRQILERALQGEPVPDIAAALAVSRRTVHRALQLLQQRLTTSAEGPVE